MAARLQQFEVVALFGEFHHVIPLNLDSRITAILAPNGLGKTVCLKLIEALFTQKYSFFRATTFDRLFFTFDAGERVEVKRQLIAKEKQTKEDGPQRFEIEIKYTSSEGKSEQWKPTRSAIPAQRYDYIDNFVRQVTRRGPELWTDDLTGEELTAEDVFERYGDEIPENFRSRHATPAPKEYLRLIKSIECHLIETQRLLNMAATTAPSDHAIYFEHTQRRRESPLAVTQKARRLSEILRSTLTEYANLSQSLDRSFPKRVVENRGQGKLSQIEIKEQLSALEGTRTKLTEVGILDATFDPVAIPIGDLEKDVAKVLEIYIEDTSKKLHVFDKLLDQVGIFQDLLNRRLLKKQIVIERRSGFGIKSDRGPFIPLDKLSSGEQHRLILLFELLFEVKEGSLILIDEPELSLHVGWQKSFLEDIDQIIKLNKFDVVLATHSPQLIGRRYDLSVTLAPVE
jgi:predicted ATP-binding protein involved in virulence